MKVNWRKYIAGGGFLILLTVFCGMGLGIADEPILTVKRGKIGELNLNSGYMVVNEVKISLDRETTVIDLTKEEEPRMSLRDLRRGMRVAVFFETQWDGNKAVQVDFMGYRR